MFYFRKEDCRKAPECDIPGLLAMFCVRFEMSFLSNQESLFSYEAGRLY